MLERLTLTWDVFKWCYCPIKRNPYSRLTLTWDVFKYNSCRTWKVLWLWLTLTWDVFKCAPTGGFGASAGGINFNMRCI